MPDWTYRTLFRPVLFRIPVRTSRDLTLAAIGRLGRIPGGRLVIEFMGHMRPPRPLERKLGDVSIATPVGLAPGIDPHLLGLPGLSRFGFGFIEIGPVTCSPCPEARVARNNVTETIAIEPADTNPGLAWVAGTLDRIPSPRPAVIVRLARESTTTDDDVVTDRLANHAATFSIPVPLDDSATTRERWLGRVRHTSSRTGRPVFVVVPANADDNVMVAIEAAMATGAAGVIVSRAEFDGHAELGQTWLDATCRWTQRLRASLGDETCLIAAAGIHSPGDAEALVDSGATLVGVDSGLVFTGPGLPKRTNELLLLRSQRRSSGTRDDSSEPLVRQKWPWLCMLGLSMLIGGVMALVIACTRVIMPYDEAMSGLTRTKIAGVSPRLLPFMTHDRVSLSGAMLGVGILFTGLAWYAARLGQHWAERAVIVPAGVGFLSFFSFLGFGYFDPLHAFVTTILFQFLLMALIGRAAPLLPCGIADRTNDRAWLRAQWGQLGFVTHGALVLVAGLVISVIGMTSVFVQEDLEYLGLCASDLTAVPGLVPLVAHDRGTFGGMLIVTGLTMLLAALWGFRRGAAWLWWTFTAAGTVGYTVAIAVHHAVAYDNLLHLAPAYGGLALVWLSAAASHGYLCDTRECGG